MTTFPSPHNPENLPPAAPGYRYLGKDEIVKPTDELWMRSGSYWAACQVSCRDLFWTYRRAICVDDQDAPPPKEWAKSGYEIIAPGQSYHVGHGWEAWLDGRWVSQAPTTQTILANIYYRRPTPSMNTATSTQSAQTKTALKPGQFIVVNVHDSAALSRAVQEIAFAAGWSWKGTMRETEYWPDPIKSYPNGAAICLLSDKDINHADVTWYKKESPNALFLDARTDLGQLIDLLAAPAIVAPKVNGYEAKYTKGDDVVVFGCAKIPTLLFSEGKRFLDLDISSEANRFVADFGLNSGVRITSEQIREIADYIETVNKA